jgi:hypothetical protein
MTSDDQPKKEYVFDPDSDIIASDPELLVADYWLCVAVYTALADNGLKGGVELDKKVEINTAKERLEWSAMGYYLLQMAMNIITRGSFCKSLSTGESISNINQLNTFLECNAGMTTELLTDNENAFKDIDEKIKVLRLTKNSADLKIPLTLAALFISVSNCSGNIVSEDNKGNRKKISEDVKKRYHTISQITQVSIPDRVVELKQGTIKFLVEGFTIFTRLHVKMFIESLEHYNQMNRISDNKNKKYRLEIHVASHLVTVVENTGAYPWVLVNSHLLRMRKELLYHPHIIHEVPDIIQFLTEMSDNLKRHHLDLRYYHLLREYTSMSYTKFAARCPISVCLSYIFEHNGTVPEDNTRWSGAPPGLKFDTAYGIYCNFMDRGMQDVLPFKEAMKRLDVKTLEAFMDSDTAHIKCQYSSKSAKRKDEDDETNDRKDDGVEEPGEDKKV